jgi:hypothetical protein
MIITVTPEDLIRRCLWSEYKRFVLKSRIEEDIKLIIKENKPIVLSENDAYVIGLLKVIETDNLVHRFIVHMKDVINIKSNIFDKNVYLSVKIVENELDNFKKRFPDYWEADYVYSRAISDLIEFIENKKELIKELEVYEFKIKERKVRYYQSKDIKKVLES